MDLVIGLVIIAVAVLLICKASAYLVAAPVGAGPSIRHQPGLPTRGSDGCPRCGMALVGGASLCGSCGGARVRRGRVGSPRRVDGGGRPRPGAPTASTN